MVHENGDVCEQKFRTESVAKRHLHSGQLELRILSHVYLALIMDQSLRRSQDRFDAVFVVRLATRPLLQRL